MKKLNWKYLVVIGLLLLSLVVSGCDTPTDAWTDSVYFNQLYVWNGTAYVDVGSSISVGGGGGGGATVLDDLTDVFDTSAVEGDMLYYDQVSGTWMVGTRAGLAGLFAGVTILDDLSDVRVPAPADQNFLYWDNAASEWTYRVLVDTDIPAAIARDAEVAADITTHSALTTGVHGVTGTVLGTEDVDDTPVDGATTDPISSNWAYDHDAATTGVHGLGSTSFAGVGTSGQFLKFIPAAHVFFLVGVGATPHTSNIVGIAGATVTVTATHGKKFFNPYMNGASYMHLWNTTRGTDAWIEDIDGTLGAPGDVLTLTDTVPGDWQNGDALLASYDGVSEWMEIDCSPRVSADAVGAYIEASLQETGSLSAASTLAIGAGGGAAPSLWSQVVDRSIVLYTFANFHSDQKFRVRLRSGAATSIAAVAFYIYGELHDLTQAT